MSVDDAQIKEDPLLDEVVLEVETCPPLLQLSPHINDVNDGG